MWWNERGLIIVEAGERFQMSWFASVVSYILELITLFGLTLINLKYFYQYKIIFLKLIKTLQKCAA